jgi:hypothetical protein
LLFILQLFHTKISADRTLVAPLPHSHLASNNIHSSIHIPNKRKWHENFNAINTTASPLVFFLVSMPLWVNTTNRKHEKPSLFENPKIPSCTHTNPKS